MVLFGGSISWVQKQKCGAKEEAAGCAEMRGLSGRDGQDACPYDPGPALGERLIAQDLALGILALYMARRDGPVFFSSSLTCWGPCSTS